MTIETKEIKSENLVILVDTKQTIAKTITIIIIVVICITIMKLIVIMKNKVKKKNRVKTKQKIVKIQGKCHKKATMRLKNDTIITIGRVQAIAMSILHLKSIIIITIIEYNLENDAFNSIERTREYNVHCVVCIGGVNVIENGKMAAVSKHQPMGRLNKPQDVDEYIAQVDQHQRRIHTQSNSCIRSPNEKPMPHTIIVPSTLVVATHNTNTRWVCLFILLLFVAMDILLDQFICFLYDCKFAGGSRHIDENL